VKPLKKPKKQAEADDLKAIVKGEQKKAGEILIKKVSFNNFA